MKLVPKKVTRTVARQILLAKKNSPHIFFVVGVAGAVGSTVLACRATLKLEEVVDEITSQLSEVKEMGETAVASERIGYSEKDYHKDLAVSDIRSGVKVARLYGPAIGLGVISLGALTGSHVQLSRRNAALTATLGLVSKAYDDYRSRIQEELGVERERDIYHGIKNEAQLIDGKTKTVTTHDPNNYSIYARAFDETNSCWEKNNEYNRTFLQCQQNYYNQKLHARGHIFLNEVYDALGFDHSQAGAIVGWVLNGEGDGFIDFGLFEKSAARFINGDERSIILDFNVDGVVYDKI